MASRSKPGVEQGHAGSAGGDATGPAVGGRHAIPPPPPPPPLPAPIASAKDALHALRQASARGPSAVLATGAPLLAAFAGGQRAAFVTLGRAGWRPASPGADDDLGRRVHRLPREAASWDSLHLVRETALTFVPVRPGSLALVLDAEIDPTSDVAAALQVAVSTCELALASAERIRDLEEVLAELNAQENVALEILSVREVDQVLISISHKALALLDADMSGVLMTEGGELVMRSCLGHRSLETARLRMRAGQGVAGRVLETGEPCKVDSYLQSESISHDFDVLARLENARAALGAPLRAHGEIIGVLEVWRRRHSAFTDRHVRRIVALANLATIAIENARLYNSQQEALRQLADAEQSLARQLDALTESAGMQRALTQLLLEGEGLPAIVRTIAGQVAGQVAFFTNDFDPLAFHPQHVGTDALAAELRRIAPSLEERPGAHVAPFRDGWLTVQAVRAGRDRLGWFCLLSSEPPDTKLELAVGEAVLSCALSQLEQRAAEHARTETRDEILADLLEGTDERCQAAISRARRIHIDLGRPHRVVRGTLDRFEQVVEAERWAPARVERLRRDLRGMAQRIVAGHGGGELVTIRGQGIVALVPCTQPDDARTTIAALDAEISRLVPGVTAVWGVSAAHASPEDFRRANTEAQAALRAARRMGDQRVVVYDQLGVVRLLLASGQEADLVEFVDEVVGPVIEHDRKHDTALLATMRAYFDCDCSQQEAAKRLFVHHKTLRYRIERIEALTSLNLRRHEDRLRADLALKIHDVMEMNKAGREGDGAAP